VGDFEKLAGFMANLDVFHPTDFDRCPEIILGDFS
jgi:hypothetical protein